MGWFDFWREDGRNTYFSPRRSAVVADLRLVLVGYLSVIVAATLLMVIIGTRGKTRWATFVKVLLSLHTGVSILLSLFGQDWQTSRIRTTCPYSMSERHSLEAFLGVHVGLKCVNITMEGVITTQHGVGEIKYNERFQFDRATDMAEAYHRAQHRGLPQAILYIAEYFAVDGGGLRWQRALRASGHFAFILLWSAFTSWLVSNLLLLFVVFQGAALFTLTGAMMMTSSVLYHCLQPAYPLVVPFPDAYIQLHYSWCFWLVAVSGTITFLTGCAILVMRKVLPLQVSKFFLLDSTHLTEEFEPELPKRCRFLSVVTEDDDGSDDYIFDDRRYSAHFNKAYMAEEEEEEEEEIGDTPAPKCCGHKNNGTKEAGHGDYLRPAETRGSISSGGSCLVSADDETLPRASGRKYRPSVSFVDETRTAQNEAESS